MNDLTLVTVNWNQREVLELMLKSYVHHHYNREPLKLIVVDNGSEDDSKSWLSHYNIPFLSLTKNVWHEPALNLVFPFINTKYCLLNDTDIEYLDNVYDYLNAFDDTCKSAGEYIDWDCYHDQKIKPRISPWFMLWELQAAKDKGIEKWREGDNWVYDVGSWYTERLQEVGFTNHNIPRYPGNQDSDLISMRYPKYNHLGKTSWDIYNQHPDRVGEVEMRRNYVKTRLALYEGIDLRNKFIWPH